MMQEIRTDGSTPICRRCGQALDVFGRCTNFRWACAGGSKEGWATLPDGNYVKQTVYEDVYSQLCEEVRKRTMAEVRVDQLTEEARLANNAVSSHANQIVSLTTELNELRDQKMALLLVVDDCHRIMEERADKIDDLHRRLVERGNP